MNRPRKLLHLFIAARNQFPLHGNEWDTVRTAQSWSLLAVISLQEFASESASPFEAHEVADNKPSKENTDQPCDGVNGERDFLRWISAANDALLAIAALAMMQRKEERRERGTTFNHLSRSDYLPRRMWRERGGMEMDGVA